ncbi:nucleotidyltransferase family protein [Arcobacter sp. F2176]|uniref:nucleotidyltransferase family protein n=1 Tax=Arcobacter sp. F2176 TaxID=2044511 RepID=UPI00100B40CD|nr:nucleotidyltransferase domain-containing protein [Arcobacter sp. F2176]RXJ81947.1 hypothetical protein CRU95_03430 [Arcobacter sp. F2176]
MTKEYIINYLSEHKDEFSKKFGITKLGLFDSYVRSEAKENSDIDILVELENGLINIYDKKSEFRNVLENHFQKKINIVREKYLIPIIKEDILREVKYI